MEDAFRSLSPVDLDDDRPIALRRKRRSSSIGAPKADNAYKNNITNNIAANVNARSRNQYGVETPPPTPKRARKRVRFSDPGPRSPVPSIAASSGLTPFLRKTSLSATNSPSSRSRRRHSTPAQAQWDDTPLYQPFSGTIQFEPLRDVLDNRVKRRLRRNGLSEELNSIEQEKRQESARRKTEVEKLKEELRERDEQVQSLKDELSIAHQLGVVDDDATVSDGMTSSRMQELEDEILRLKGELQQREEESSRDAVDDNEYWTLAASPLRSVHDFDVTDFDLNNDFSDGENSMPRTPSRRKSKTASRNPSLASADWERTLSRSFAAGSSFPSPPSTQPNTPSSRHSTSPVTTISTASASAQACLPDPEVVKLQSRLKNLRGEMGQLAAKVESTSDYQHRLLSKLAPFMAEGAEEDPQFALDSAVDEVVTALTLAQNSVTESTHRFQALKTEIRSLGFPDEDLEATVTTIANQFRSARIELERLIPGEQTIGFENDKLLGLLISRLRTLIEHVQKQDGEIDQYHEQELSLRQQLGARVDGMRIVEGRLEEANGQISQLQSELEESEESNSRLQLALSGYRDEVQKLEKLIMQMEGQHASAQENMRQEATAVINEREENLRAAASEQETNRAQIEGQHIIITELSGRLDVVLSTSHNLQTELYAVTAEKERIVADLKQEIANLHNQRLDVSMADDVASKEARIAELQQELEQTAALLKDAQASVASLLEQNQRLEEQVKGIKVDEQIAVSKMKEQIEAVLGTLASLQRHNDSIVSTSRRHSAPESMIRPGEFLKPELVRKAKRRKVDENEAGVGEQRNDVMDIC